MKKTIFLCLIALATLPAFSQRLLVSDKIYLKDSLRFRNSPIDSFFAAAKARANHTGTQAISTVTGLQGAIDAKLNITDTVTLVQKSDSTLASRITANTSSVALKKNNNDSTATAGYTSIGKHRNDSAVLRGLINTNTSDILTKLNISDTANIRVRLHAGSNVTITGTYPDQTIAASGGGGSTDTASLSRRIDWKENVFNVKTYGATGNGYTNDQTAIQAAINACFAAGGGIVYFPNGQYILSGSLVTSENSVNPNSQLYVPPSWVDPTRTHIKFLGETPPNYIPASLGVDTSYAHTGVVIKSTINGSGSQPAVFGGIGTVVSGNPPFNFNIVSFENLTILVKSFPSTTGPTMSGINGTYYGSTQVTNCIVGIDTSLYRDTLPANQVAGIITTKSAGEAVSSITNTLVYGFKYGIVAGEHLVLNNAQSQGCYAGLVVQANSHAVCGSRFLSQWNAIDVLIPNTTTAGIAAGSCNISLELLDVEIWNTTTRWFNNVQTVADTGNRASGYIKYHIVNSAGAVVTTANFSKYNTTGLRLEALSTGMQTNTVIVSPLSGANTSMTIGKNTPSAATYKNTAASDGVVVNYGSGNMSFLNDYSSGNINFAPAGYSAPQLILNSANGMIVQDQSATTASAKTQWDNNRGSFASYGSAFNGGSAATGTFFGINRADRFSLFSDGASNLGMNVGTLNATPLVLGTNNAERARFLSGGQLGIGVTAPTAMLHLKAGTATASTAPLKFTSGTNLTTPEAGAVEFDGTNYFATSSTTRYTLAKTLTNTATLDFPSTNSGIAADLTITVTGAADGDAVSLGVPNGSTTATATWTAWVSATNTVTVRFIPHATEDPASGTFRVSVLKY